MEKLVSQFVKAASDIPSLTVTQFATIFGVFHTDNNVKNFGDAASQDMSLFRSRYKRLIEKDILTPPSPYETFFLSAAHDESDITRLVSALAL
jgi:glutamate-1-semialdehyde 2,1-aminomutase